MGRKNGKKELIQEREALWMWSRCREGHGILLVHTMIGFFMLLPSTILIGFQIDPKTSPIASSLRERMMFYKLNIVPRATEVCTSFNDKVQAEVIPDHNDPYRIEWIEGEITDDILVGEQVGLAFRVVSSFFLTRPGEALRLADPHRSGYMVRWPFHGSRFNSFDYAHVGQQALANDIEAIWSTVLQSRLDISPKAFKVRSSRCLMRGNLFFFSASRKMIDGWLGIGLFGCSDCAGFVRTAVRARAGGHPPGADGFQTGLRETGALVSGSLREIIPALSVRSHAECLGVYQRDVRRWDIQRLCHRCRCSQNEHCNCRRRACAPGYSVSRLPAASTTRLIVPGHPG